MEWNLIPSLGNKYEASDKGDIRNAQTKRVLKQFTNRFGYKILTVKPETDKKVNIRVHRAVAEAFYGKCPKGYVVNHKDGNKSNNQADNLEYVTSSQNNKHALDAGLRKPAKMLLYAPKGENHYRAKVTEEEVKMILRIRQETGFGNRKLEKITGISRGTIAGIVSGKTWKHINRKGE